MTTALRVADSHHGVFGFYVNCDDALCNDHFESAYGDEWPEQVAAWLAKGGFESWLEPIAIITGDESDSPVHCVECDALLPVSLTRYGLEYVRDALMSEGRRSDVLEVWHRVYGDDIARIDSE